MGDHWEIKQTTWLNLNLHLLPFYSRAGVSSFSLQNKSTWTALLNNQLCSFHLMLWPSPVSFLWCSCSLVWFNFHKVVNISPETSLTRRRRRWLTRTLMCYSEITEDLRGSPKAGNIHMMHVLDVWRLLDVQQHVSTGRCGSLTNQPSSSFILLLKIHQQALPVKTWASKTQIDLVYYWGRLRKSMFPIKPDAYITHNASKLGCYTTALIFNYNKRQHNQCKIFYSLSDWFIHIKCGLPFSRLPESNHPSASSS